MWAAELSSCAALVKCRFVIVHLYNVQVPVFLLFAELESGAL